MFFKKNNADSTSLPEDNRPFWERKKLTEMTEEEWESLCDGCGKCCLMKEGRFRILFTNVACPLLDLETGKCKDYPNRQKIVPECLKLTLDILKERPRFIPKTCAYYLILHGKKLPNWHPLISGDKESVHKAGMSVKDRAIPYRTGMNLRKYCVKWKDL